MIAKVQYQTPIKLGVVNVACTPDDTDEYIISQAISIVIEQAEGSIPFGYKNWKVIDRNES